MANNIDTQSPIIMEGKIPQHIAIIMDGNGRWAKSKGEDRIHGHQNGVHSVRNTVELCGELGVKYLTLYAFSTENWLRPQAEVDALMSLLVSTIREEVDKLKSNKVKLSMIGDMKSLPEMCQTELTEAMERTKDEEGLNLILALSYSSKWELEEAMKTIATKVKNNELDIASINDDTIKQHLCTHDIPDPELMIRTGGEQRISNFLLYQSAYTELYFTPVHWPEFTKEDLTKAISDYQQRERRFGKTSEQVLSS